jgi:hypothetical protein
MDRKTPEYIPVWQCIGCGRIEMPQTCIGVCQDKKAFFIGKDAHERALEEIARLQELLVKTRSKLLRFAQSTPRAGETEKTAAALKQQVQQLVRELPDALPNHRDLMI